MIVLHDRKGILDMPFNHSLILKIQTFSPYKIWKIKYEQIPHIKILRIWRSIKVHHFEKKKCNCLTN